MLKINSKRESGIELLKIIALYGIVLCHVYTSFSTAVDNSSGFAFFDIYTFSPIEYFAFQVIITLGYIGNIVFFVCTSWFLTDSKKNRKEKMISMIINTIIISLIYLMVYYLLGYEISKSDIIQSIFPISSESYWYITCYILFYAIYPYINTVLDSINQKQHFSLSLCIFIIYFIYVYFFNFGTLYANKLVSFVSIYLIVSYLKKYKISFCNDLKANIILFFVTSFVFYLIIFINFAIIPVKINWHVLYNPFFLLMAISLLNIFRKTVFINSTINTISALSLYVYIFHINFLFMKNTVDKLTPFVMYTFGVKYIVLIVLLFALILFLFTFSISITYYIVFQKNVDRMATKIETFINRAIDLLI